MEGMSRPQGFAFLAIAAAFAQQPVSWTTLRDATEQAFSIDVPKGWKAQGGLLRKGPLDPRVQVDMVSPDGRVSMSIGDWAVGPYAVPSGQMERFGFTEGKTYAPGHPPTATIVARYRTGEVFADVYGQARFSRVCAVLEPKSMKSMAPIFSPASEASTTTTAGEIVYRCVQNGQEKVAYVYAETSLYQANGVANWMMSSLETFLSSKDLAASAYKLVFQSASTFAENPQWHLRQAQITAANAAAALKSFNVTMQQTQARYQQWSSSMARQGQNFSDALNGRTLTVDPQTGQQREVWTGTGATRWIDGVGNVVSSNLSPGASFHALQDISR